MLFRQLYDATSSTYTYLLADEDSREAVYIDTVFEQHARDAALVEELELTLVAVLDTHVHADHVTGAWLMRERFGARIGLSHESGAEGADLMLRQGDRVSFGKRALEVRCTPGHTNGCVTYVLDDHSMAFTGDALLIRGAGRTDFQQGDARKLYHSVHEQIFSLPDDTILYPGHDYSGRLCTTVGEEKKYNPRLGGQRSVDDFVGFMENLGLAHPKQIDVALPANLMCGKPSAERPGPSKPDWAPVVLSYAGVPELTPDWVYENRDKVRIIDVREPAELAGELGYIKNAESIPLSQLTAAAADWDRQAPVVLVCHAGGRSAQAATLLSKNGFVRVANVIGGMIRWRESALPTVQSSSEG
jgi:sulfur dioxygenase